MNENIQKVLWAAGTVIATLILVAVLFPSKGHSLGATGAGITNLTGLSIDGTSPGTLAVNGASTLTGSLTVNSTVTVNGVTQTTSRNSSLTAATTTPCAIQGPSATSTVQWATMNVTTGTSTAGVITIATSTTAFATSSTLVTQSIAASQQGTVVAQGTSANGVIAPNAWVVFGVQGVPYGFTYGGTCSAEFYQVN